MSVKRDYVEIDTANNHPMLENKFVYAKDYVEELKQGFSKAYMTILKHASELIRIIEKSENKIYVRFISKPTIKYSALLELSFHPRFYTTLLIEKFSYQKYGRDQSKKMNINLLLNMSSTI